MGFQVFNKQSGGAGRHFSGSRVRLNAGSSISISGDLVREMRSSGVTHVRLLVDRDTRRVAFEPIDPVDSATEGDNGYKIQYPKNQGHSSATVSPSAFMAKSFHKDQRPLALDAAWDAHGRIVFSVPSRVWKDQI